MFFPLWFLSNARLCFLVFIYIITVQCFFVTVSSKSAPKPKSFSQKSSNDVKTICDFQQCNCTYNPTRSWRIVNCTFANDQIVKIEPGMLPSNLMELSIIGGQQLVFQQKLFDNQMRNLCRIGLDGAQNIEFEKNSLYNISVTSLLVQINTCDKLTFHPNAFANEGPVTMEVNNCGQVKVEKNVWNFLESATFENVKRIDLAEGAFIMKPRATDTDRHGPVTKIRFENVMIPALMKDVFKAILAEVVFVDSKVNNVMSEAFSGNTISSVVIANSTLDNVHAAAFSERTQLYSLEIINSQVRVMHEAALLSATTNLTVDRSRITTIHNNALSATIARTQFTNNEIGTIYPKAFTITLWSQININNNQFSHITRDALTVPKDCETPCEFTFNGNSISTLDNGGLRFIDYIIKSKEDTKPFIAQVEKNNLNQSCHCDINNWLFDMMGEKEGEEFAENNYCYVDPLIASCFDITEGLTIIKNFTDMHCLGNDELLRCTNFSMDANIVHDLPLEDSNSQLILGLIIGLVLIIAVSGTIVILLINGGMWLKRKGYCIRFSTVNTQYREEESTEIEEIIIPPEKHQDEVLPEELTQDLLQSLREKLEDPQTYEEAREMIERLYDHFITEDSYINNNRDDETHLYEELGNLQSTPPGRVPFNFLRLIEERFNLINTDLPLPPVMNGSKSVLLNEYSEPTDAEVHLYSELPSNGGGGSGGLGVGSSSGGKELRQNEINEGLNRPNGVVKGLNGSRSSLSGKGGFGNGEGSSTVRSNRSNRSNGSGSMSKRPLPEKPGTSSGG